MSQSLTFLADYQHWLNDIKQRVQSARLRVALTTKPYQPRLTHIQFGQQAVDQIAWVRRIATGLAS